MVLLCKLNHPPSFPKCDTIDVSLTVSNALQNATKPGWEDSHRRCQAQQPGRGSQVAREGRLPLNIMASIDTWTLGSSMVMFHVFVWIAIYRVLVSVLCLIAI